MSSRSTGAAGQTAAGQTAAGPWRAEAVELVRGASGGLLFGVPLLYTMEVWWTGSRSSPAQTGAVLALLFVPAYVLNRTAGFRTSRDTRTIDAVADTIETVAIGLVITAAVLVLLRQITVDTPRSAALGMILYECIPFTLGVGVAGQFLRGSRVGVGDDSGDADRGGDRQDRRDRHARADGDEGAVNGTIADVGATVIGAIFIALSIAPTDEIPMIAASMSAAWLILFAVASLVVSYAIVFVAGFSGQERRHAQEGIFQHPVTETMVSYLAALVVSGVILWLFQRETAPWDDFQARILILALPASIGGAAGRLAL
jgi:putative integral membrane protein (TIGR02587 family)